MTKGKLISLAEACRLTEESYQRMKQKERQHRDAEAQYWREYFNEDRVEELEACLRWLLYLHHGVSKGGGKPASDEWEAALKVAHQLLDGDED